MQHKRKQKPMILSNMLVYPVKSCAGIAQSHTAVTTHGLCHDRRWLLVDVDTGKFITGREHPALVLLNALPMPELGQVQLSAPAVAGRAALACVYGLSADAQPARRTVTVWGDSINAARTAPLHRSKEALFASTSNVPCPLSAWLGRAVELVFFDAGSQRALDSSYSQPGDQTAFSDGFPLLLISTASLAGLNARIAEAGNSAVPMARFRPNLVIDGALAHAEDTWRTIEIGDVCFDVVKACTRCVFTTIDSHGSPDPSGEPLRTLKDYRRSPKGIIFGMNIIPRLRADQLNAQLTVGARVRLVA
jgi:uncharacterized protein